MNRSRRRPTVFVLEDDPDQQELLCAFFSTRGCRVDAAGSLAEAREELDPSSPHDLYVLDYDLPDGVSFDLLSEGLVQSERSVVISASSALPPRPSGTHYIPKPASLEAITAAVTAVLWEGWSEAPRSSVMDRSSRPPGDEAELQLVLYISPSSHLTAVALKRLAAVLDGDPAEHPAVRIVNIETPEGLDEASHEGVLFTPTLERRAPEPRAWLVGDLTDTDAVRALVER